MDRPFILRGLCHHRTCQEEFDTLDAALDEFAWVRYRSMDVTDSGLTTWWPDEILCPDGTVMGEDDLERLRPDPGN